ncbi:MAG: hypothetical protein R3F14_06755 [Polyangiaceae bacterium]
MGIGQRLLRRGELRAARWSVPVPKTLRDQAATGQPSSPSSW